MTAIGDGLLRDNETVETVTLPETVAGIGDNAFAGMTNLTAINLETTATETIGAGAFQGTASLTELTLPQTTVAIGDAAFAGSGIESITLPEKVETLGDGAFAGCENLAAVRIESKELAVTSADAFAGLPADTVLEAPEGSLAAYFFSMSEPDQPREHVPVLTEDCVLPDAKEASLNTTDGQIAPTEEAVLTIGDASADADYVVIVEGESGIEEVIERRGGLTSRAAGLTVSLGRRAAGSYTVRYTVNERDGEGWTQLTHKDLVVSDEAPVQIGSIRYRREADGTLTAVGAAEEAAAYVIPQTAQYDGETCEVRAIAGGAFPKAEVSVTVPKSVRSVAKDAIPAGARVTAQENSPAWFYGKAYGWNLAADPAGAVATMTLPAAAAEVKAGAFRGTAAECVILPAGCAVEDGAFAECGGLLVIAFRGPAGSCGAAMAPDGVLIVNAGAAGALTGVSF